MAKYSLTSHKFSRVPAFYEASAEELRVLLSVIETEGEDIGREELSRKSGVAGARLAASLVFWTEAGIIKEDGKRSVTEEFEERFDALELKEERSVEVAKTIRSDKLYDMFSEISALMNRPMLNNREIKELTALYKQYGLSEEYILAVAKLVESKGALTVTKIVNRAYKLYEKEIYTYEELEEYIKETESNSGVEFEFRKIFGITSRALTKSEKDYFRKWSREYGYYIDIVSEAFDIAASNADKNYVKYADKILSKWFEAGLRTLSECRAFYDRERAEIAEQRKKKKETAKSAQKKEPSRFGEFNIEESFRNALDRSYKDD